MNNSNFQRNRDTFSSIISCVDFGSMGPGELISVWGHLPANPFFALANLVMDNQF